MPDTSLKTHGELEIGTRLEIRKAGEGRGAALVSQILAPPAGNLMLIAVPTAHCEWVEWGAGTPIRASFTKKDQGVWLFDATILSRSVSGTVQAYLIQLEAPPHRRQRREHFRLECTLDVVFRYLTALPPPATAGDSPLVPGVTLNVSEGGTSFLAVPAGEQAGEIEITLELEGHGSVVARGQVLRRERIDHGSTARERYAVRFTGIAARDRDALVRYVFKRQRKQLRRI
ncbi:MAG: hypothetical protein GX153_08265 [Clostridiaceae bacterium]|jgi:c-di-GMP-binding flagellar brake protein YcgR|nr:hypothetical protein [Clostridiaceae bacterium]